MRFYLSLWNLRYVHLIYRNFTAAGCKICWTQVSSNFSQQKSIARPVHQSGIRPQSFTSLDADITPGLFCSNCHRYFDIIEPALGTSAHLFMSNVSDFRSLMDCLVQTINLFFFLYRLSVRIIPRILQAVG